MSSFTTIFWLTFAGKLALNSESSSKNEKASSQNQKESRAEAWQFVWLPLDPGGLRSSSTSSCSSATFPAHGAPHGRVCGEVIDYQYYSVDSFIPISSYGVHVDGLSNCESRRYSDILLETIQPLLWVKWMKFAACLLVSPWMTSDPAVSSRYTCWLHHSQWHHQLVQCSHW